MKRWVGEEHSSIRGVGQLKSINPSTDNFARVCGVERHRVYARRDYETDAESNLS
jgi:hypothetical protein